MASRAVLFFNRTKLKSKVVHAPAGGTRISGQGITFALSRTERYLMLTMDIGSVSPLRLRTANRILNSYSSFVNPRTKRKGNVFISSGLKQEIPKRRINLSKYFVQKELEKINATLGLRLFPDSLSLDSDRDDCRLMVDAYDNTYDVETVLYSKGRLDQVPVNCATNNYKEARKVLDRTVYALERY